MRILKSHPLLKLVNSYLIDASQPSNISYLWNFGSLLAVCLIIQIITGVTLAMHYSPNVLEAFNSIEHIMRDVNNGWLVRYLHSNTASAFFFLVYLHIGRGMYYGSYRAPRTLVWAIGTVMLIVMMATAFLGYVLPYGQMSLWGATVITNLISAIPWIGQDIVESKFAIIINLCLGCAALILFLGLIIYKCLLDLILLSCNIYLPTIGIVHQNALKKGNRALRLNKQEYISIPYSFIAFLVGLIDGDGYIQVTKTSKGFIAIKLVISLHLEDISTLEYIYSVLKIGKINIYKDLRSPTCKLVINKTDLQEILFPLLIYHNIFFLTFTRTNQFNLAVYIIKNDIKLYNVINNIVNIPPVFEIPENPLDYASLLFFRNWIVGFTCSEGSFFIKRNNDACFQLKQKIHTNLFEAFKLIFSTDRKINTTNNYSQFSVGSISDIQQVINFFSFSGLHPLAGRTLLYYLKWVEALNFKSDTYLVNSSYNNQFKNKIVKYFNKNTNKGRNYSTSRLILTDENNTLTIIPIMIYDNALDNRKIAIKNNRNKAGVYRWVHNDSNKFYIGSSTNMGQRFSSYFALNWLESQAKFNIIYKSLLKHGHYEFRLEIIEYCAIENTLEREQYYLNSLNPE